MRSQLFLLIFCLFCGHTFAFASAMTDEVAIPYREPASAPLRDDPLDGLSRARVDYVVDHKELRAISAVNDWRVGEILALESQSEGVGIIAFVEVLRIEDRRDGLYELTCELQRQSRLNFVQVGDQLVHLDLSSDNEKYKGTTDLLIKSRGGSVSAKYKPLFTQGVAVGETAESLWQDEFLITWYGSVSYGVRDWLTVTSVVPGYFLRTPNASFKARFYEYGGNIFAAGLTFTDNQEQDKSTLNLNFYWDSISAETTLSHTFVSLALLTFSDAEDTSAIKSFGTSSLQTGYEFILHNWDRVLVGPSYNFSSQAVGGYLTYLKIWDRFHLSLSLTSTDLGEIRLSPDNGYFVLFDAYWRF